MVVKGLNARDWPTAGRFYHLSSGNAYGPSNPGESLDDYKTRVRGAYGSLRGVEFRSLKA